MTPGELYRACGRISKIWDKHAIKLTQAERKHLTALAKTLLKAQAGQAQLPKRNVGRPRKNEFKSEPEYDKALRGWQVAKFAESVLSGEPIELELFYAVALSAKAVLQGAEPEVVFKIGEGKPENRGLSPLGDRKGEALHEISIAFAVDTAYKKYKIRKASKPMTRAYQDVGKKNSLSTSRVKALNRQALSRAPGDTHDDKIRWLRQARK